MTKNMKEIERIANEANKAGLSYGKYIEQLDKEKEQRKRKRKGKKNSGRR